MPAQISFYLQTEPDAEAAFRIAYDYLERADAVSDEMATYVFLAEEITRLAERGVTHKIKLANLAIQAFLERFVIDGY